MAYKRTHITISKPCLERSKYKTKEQKVVIATLLLHMNIPIQRSRVFKLDVKGLGTIKTHGKKRNLNKEKYFSKYSKVLNKKKRIVKIFSEEYLLF